jgi:hypothetical protein
VTVPAINEFNLGAVFVPIVEMAFSNVPSIRKVARPVHPVTTKVVSAGRLLCTSKDVRFVLVATYILVSDVQFRISNEVKELPIELLRVKANNALYPFRLKLTTGLLDKFKTRK